ncbi:MAG: hypothetical protein Q9217_002942 [Psora testacea]
MHHHGLKASMANPAHCAYCFETLAADLENREPLSFQQVQDLWAQYELLQNGKAKEQNEEELDTDPEDSDSLMDDLEGAGEEEAVQMPEPTKSPPATLQLPSISRLQAPSPASISSTSSTPSSLSTTSSSAALAGDSKSSSNSSFFSFGRSKQPSPAAPKQEEHPLFVTWNVISPRTGHKSLRGCIGTFDAQELSTGLSSYALTAAFSDTRFPPIHQPEFPTLSCSVTLLTNFTPCASPLDWVLGVHGIRISFQHHNKRYGATYLPDVATEQGWTKEETIVSLMRKAGWSGRSREWNGRDVKELRVVRYEGVKSRLEYGEWTEWRNHQQEDDGWKRAYVYLVTDLALGGELFDRICRKGSYYESDAADLIRATLSAVAYLHDHGIVHRDLKPENLLFRTPEDNADLLIADFGLSRIMDEEAFHVLTTTCGTPGYMAPEIFKKTGHGKPVDVWAIGVITYFLLCGYTPFDRESNLEEMQAILVADYSFTPLEYWRSVSISARLFIKRCLTVDPHKRMTAHEALSHPFVDPEARENEGVEQEQGDLLPVIMKNFNARRTLHAAIDTIRAINKLREGGAQGLMDGAMSADPRRNDAPGAGGRGRGRGGGGGGGGGDQMEGIEQNGGAMQIDSRGNARGQTEEMIREQQRRVEETARGLWNQARERG